MLRDTTPEMQVGWAQGGRVLARVCIWFCMCAL